MPKSKPPYPAEFRQQIIELHGLAARLPNSRGNSARRRKALPTGSRRTRVTEASRCPAKRG